MNFEQSLIPQRSRPMSQPNQYSGENQNIGNLNNGCRIRGPHSSNSDPKFLKKKQTNIQKTTSLFSEEEKLKEEIENLKMKQEKYEAKFDELSENLAKYRQLSQEALLRGDEKMMNRYDLCRSECLMELQDYGKMMYRIIADRRELAKKLQKLQAEQI